MHNILKILNEKWPPSQNLLYVNHGWQNNFTLRLILYDRIRVPLPFIRFDGAGLCTPSCENNLQMILLSELMPSLFLENFMCQPIADRMKQCPLQISEITLKASLYQIETFKTDEILSMNQSHSVRQFFLVGYNYQQL